MAIQLTDKLYAATGSKVIVDAVQVAGGYMAVENESARLALTSAVTLEGTLVYQIDTEKTYRYTSSGWEEVVTSISLEDLEITASSTELNILDGATITTAELNKLDGLTTTTNELNQLKGVNLTDKFEEKAPLESPALTGVPTAPTAALGTNTTQIANTQFVKAEIDNVLAASNAMIFKGTLGIDGTIQVLPAEHSVGDTYKVITAGTYAGYECEIGALIICITDGKTGDNSHWTVVQPNEDGVVIGPKSSQENRVPVFNDTTGRVLKDSGFTIGTSVPEDAVFTDTDTKNTAGATNTDKKIYLIGAETQTENPETHSHDGVYVGTDGRLYSDSKQVLTEHPSISTSTDTATTGTATHGGTISVVDNITRDDNGHVTSINTKTITLPQDNDTKNTAGAGEKSDTKLFLVGAETQTENPETHSNNKVYIGSDNCLYSNNEKVLTQHPTPTILEDTTSDHDAEHGKTFTVIDTINRDDNGHVTSINTKTITLPQDNDTKNTTGAEDTDKKIYLIGAEAQDESPITYSHDTAYVGTDGCLYSNDKKVITVDDVATSAAKLNTSAAGSTTVPVYFSEGKPVETNLLQNIAGKYTTKAAGGVGAKVQLADNITLEQLIKDILGIADGVAPTGFSFSISPSSGTYALDADPVTISATWKVSNDGTYGGSYTPTINGVTGDPKSASGGTFNIGTIDVSGSKTSVSISGSASYIASDGFDAGTLSSTKSFSISRNCYYGADSLSSNEARQSVKGWKITFNLNKTKAMFAYPKGWGTVNIKEDSTGYDVTNLFNCETITKNGGDYYQYTAKDINTASNKSYTLQ